MTQIKGKISGYSHEGAGVIRGEQKVHFVPGVLRDEEILYKIEDSNKKGKVAFGTLDKVITESEYRVNHECALYGSCGGCQLQHASYTHQLQIKQEIIERAFRALGRDSKAVDLIQPVIGAEEPWGYRNKGIFAVKKQEGNVLIGFYQKKSQWIAGIGCTGLFSKEVNGLIQAISFWLESADVELGANGLHHLMIRQSKTTGQIILVLIGNSTKPNWIEDFLRTFVPVQPEDLPPCAKAPKELLIGIGWLNAKLKEGPVISGKAEALWGKLVLVEQLGKVIYGISPESFFQVNTAQAKVLYDQVVKLACLTRQERVWDLYCGTGTISLYLADKAKSVLGVESVGAAVKDGQANARINKIDNVEFVADLVEEFLLNWRLRNEQKEAEVVKTENKRLAKGELPDVVVLDPPSKGCEPAVIEGLLAVKPKRIVYVSCDPATLVRDLKLLTATGEYEIKQVQPVDMFPQTSHVESIILMTNSGLKGK